MGRHRSSTIRAATRASALARWQTDHVAELLALSGEATGLDITVVPVVVETYGDAHLDTPIWEMGGKGVFVKEVQAAVLDGRADIAVHSCKDLQASTPEGLVLACVPERADPRDALVGSTLDALPTGSVVATGSVRRRAQLAWLRPDLTFAGLRGNIARRLERSEDFGAIVMAAAALERLGLSARAADILDPAVMLPQVGQGALAVECRSDAGDIRDLLRLIEHRVSRVAVDVERAFLAELGGDCDLPAAAHAVVGPTGEIAVEGMLASLDGHRLIRHRVVGSMVSDSTVTNAAASDTASDCSEQSSNGSVVVDPTLIGRSLALYLLDNGGDALLRG